jgi:hypothetical protein
LIEFRAVGRFLIGYPVIQLEKQGSCQCIWRHAFTANVRAIEERKVFIGKDLVPFDRLRKRKSYFCLFLREDDFQTGMSRFEDFVCLT